MVVHRDDLGKPKSYRNFLAKRIKRVVPLYWTLTTLAVVLFLSAPQIAANSKSGINVLWILFSYLFIPTSLSGNNTAPVVGVGWTLDYEMFFYVVFASLMKLNQRLFVTIMTVVFSVMVLGGTIIRPENLYGKFVSDWLLMDFVGGVWVAHLMLTFKRISARISMLMTFLSIFMIISTFGFSVPEVGPVRLILWGLPSIILVQGMTYLRLQDGLIRRSILTLGNASYSIYLSQVFTIPLWTGIVSKAGVSSSFDIQVITIFMLTSVSGVLVWYFLERNLNKISNIMYRPRRENALS